MSHDDCGKVNERVQRPDCPDRTAPQSGFFITPASFTDATPSTTCFPPASSDKPSLHSSDVDRRSSFKAQALLPSLRSWQDRGGHLWPPNVRQAQASRGCKGIRCSWSYALVSLPHRVITPSRFISFGCRHRRRLFDFGVDRDSRRPEETHRLQLHLPGRDAGRVGFLPPSTRPMLICCLV